MIRQMVMKYRLRKVCRALQIKPLPWQAQYATAKVPPCLSGGRRNGKTTAVVLRALVQRPRSDQDLAQILSQDPDANTAGKMRFIYGEFRRKYRECVTARSIPAKQPPIWQEAVRRTWEIPPSVARSMEIGDAIGRGLAAGLKTPAPDGMTIMTTSNPYSGYPTTYEEAVAIMDEIHPPAAEETHEWLKKNLNLPQTEPVATLYANNRPIITIRADGLDAFCTALRRIGAAAAEAAAALGAMVRATGDADLIARYGTDKEIHYITHHHKARIRKKYRNRVLRRARRDERRSRHEKNRAPRA